MPTKGTRIGVRLDAEELERLKRLATQADVTLSDKIRQILTDSLQQPDERSRVQQHLSDLQLVLSIYESDPLRYAPIRPLLLDDVEQAIVHLDALASVLRMELGVGHAPDYASP